MSVLSISIGFKMVTRAFENIAWRHYGWFKFFFVISQIIYNE